MKKITNHRNGKCLAMHWTIKLQGFLIFYFFHLIEEICGVTNVHLQLVFRKKSTVSKRFLEFDPSTVYF